MNKVHANISLFELIKIMNQQDILLRALGQTSICDGTSSDKGSSKSTDTLASMLNALLLEEKSLCPPFLLTFQVFNFNVHNFLFDYGASVNVMPLFVAKKINAQWNKTYAQVIQLDRTHVLAISNWLTQGCYPLMNQCINIVIVDISEEYGVLMSKDW